MATNKEIDIEKFLMIPGQIFSNMARGSTYDQLYEEINNLILLLNQYYKEHPNKDLDEDINNLMDDYSDFVDVLFAPRKGRKIDKKMRQKFEKLSGKLYDGYKFRNKHLTEKSIANPDDYNLALNILGVSGTTKKAREDKEKFELEQKRLAEEKAEKLKKQIEDDKLRREKEVEDFKQAVSKLDFSNALTFDTPGDFMHNYAKEFEIINLRYKNNKINASEFIKRYKQLYKLISIYDTPKDIYGKPMNRYDDYIIESGKIYDTITKSAKLKIASKIKSGLQSKKQTDFKKDLDIIKQKLQNTMSSKKSEKKKIVKRTPKEANIREHLNTLSLTKLKDIARKSNLHTRIKLSSPKSIIVESIAQLYEHENGKFKSKSFELKL